MYPLIRITSDIAIPTYFFVISLAYCIGLVWLYRRSFQYNLPAGRVLDSSLIVMVGGFLGSRLFHIIWEHPGYYWENPWNTLKIWQGGFVFYGGVIGAVFPLYFFLKKTKQDIFQWMTLYAPVIPLVDMIGRGATLLSGSGFGRPTDLPWAIVYPPGTEAPGGVPLHPTPIYAMIWEIFSLVVVLRLERKDHWKQKGRLLFVVMILYGVGRTIIEQYRGDFRGETILNLTISTWISLFFLMVGVLGLMRSFSKNGLSAEADRIKNI